jgi:hypothetical protein
MTGARPPHLFNSAQAYRAIGPTFVIAMTDTPEHVVIPYSRFLECLEKRKSFDHIPPRPPTTDADIPTVPHDPSAPIATAWRTP